MLALQPKHGTFDIELHLLLTVGVSERSHHVSIPLGLIGKASLHPELSRARVAEESGQGHDHAT